jgi:IS5 family transposase
MALGMTVHIGVDADSGRVHSLVGIEANESDVSPAHAAWPQRTGVWRRLHGRHYSRRTARQLGEVACRAQTGEDQVHARHRIEGSANHRRTYNAQIRARVKHPFYVVNNLFHHRNIRYKGLAKNTAQLLFDLANLILATKPVVGTTEEQSVLSAQDAPGCARDGGKTALNRRVFCLFMKSYGYRGVQHHAQTSLISIS